MHGSLLPTFMENDLKYLLLINKWPVAFLTSSFHQKKKKKSMRETRKLDVDLHFLLFAHAFG